MRTEDIQCTITMHFPVLLVLVSWALTIPYPARADGEFDNFFCTHEIVFYLYHTPVRYALAGFRSL